MEPRSGGSFVVWKAASQCEQLQTQEEVLTVLDFTPRNQEDGASGGAKLSNNNGADRRRRKQQFLDREENLLKTFIQAELNSKQAPLS